MPDIRALSSSELAKFTSKVSTGKTKDLVKAGAEGDDRFPKLLQDYKWSNTLDFNMAAIITSIFAYIGKKDDELKADAKKIVDQVGQALVNGDGQAIRDEFKSISGKKITDKLLGGKENDFLARAAKITPWVVHKNKVMILQRTLTKISGKKFKSPDNPTKSDAPTTTAATKKTAKASPSHAPTSPTPPEPKVTKKEYDKDWLTMTQKSKDEILKDSDISNVRALSFLEYNSHQNLKNMILVAKRRHNKENLDLFFMPNFKYYTNSYQLDLITMSDDKKYKIEICNELLGKLKNMRTALQTDNDSLATMMPIYNMHNLKKEAAINSSTKIMDYDSYFDELTKQMTDILKKLEQLQADRDKRILQGTYVQIKRPNDIPWEREVTLTVPDESMSYESMEHLDAIAMRPTDDGCDLLAIPNYVEYYKYLEDTIKKQDNTSYIDSMRKELSEYSAGQFGNPDYMFQIKNAKNVRKVNINTNPSALFKAIDKSLSDMVKEYQSSTAGLKYVPWATIKSAGDIPAKSALRPFFLTSVSEKLHQRASNSLAEYYGYYAIAIQKTSYVSNILIVPKLEVISQYIENDDLFSMVVNDPRAQKSLLEECQDWIQIFEQMKKDLSTGDVSKLKCTEITQKYLVYGRVANTPSSYFNKFVLPSGKTPKSYLEECCNKLQDRVKKLNAAASSK